MELSPAETTALLTTVKEILKNYQGRREELLPILQAIQERLGFVPLIAQEEVAAFSGVAPVEVYEIVTFFNQFRLTPPGRHTIKVCMGTACHMKGGHIILESWERRLNIKVGETTPDREFGLERVACVGCCALAPVVVIDDQVHGRITPTRVDGLLFAYQLAKEQSQEKREKE